MCLCVCVFVFVCVCVCVCVTESMTRDIRAVRKIREGEEITISYRMDLGLELVGPVLQGVHKLHKN